METRFGLKDFALFGLLVILIGAVLLAMVQFDHQKESLNQLAVAQQAQADDIGQIQRTLKGWRTAPPAMATSAEPGNGPRSTAGPTTGPADPSDPFARMRAAMAMPDYAVGDTLVTSGPNANKMTPLLNTDAFAGAVQDLVLQGLLTRDPVTLAWQPMLAEPGWTVVDRSAEYQAYVKAHPTTAPVDDDHPAPPDPARPVPVSITFKVRPEAVFSDGQPVTADDVVWTFAWIMNPKVEAVRMRSALSKIRSVTKTPDGGVRFDFAEPYFDYLGLAGSMPVLPAHHYQAYDPSVYNQIPCDLMGSGPYQFQDPKAWHPGEEVVLYRNEKFWGVKPALSSIRYRVIIQDQVRLTAFKNRELDRFPANPAQYKSLLANGPVMERTQHFAYDTANAGYRFVAWNQQRGGKPTRFADKRVRQAMTMLIDRQRLCDEIMEHLATVATGPFNRLGKQCDPGIAPWPFDPSRARQLLVDAGYKDDGAGSMRGADGQPFSFKLTYPSGSPLVDRSVLFMKDTMAQAGVTLDPDPQDWSVFADRLKQHEFDAIMLGWTAGIEDDIYQMFDGHEIANGGEDWMSYRNPELDGLIEQARQTIDEHKRLALWRRCHAIVHEDQPYTFMYVAKSLVFLDGRFKHVEVVPVGLNDPTEWYVPAGLQKYTN